MTFILFLASVAVIEYILKRDSRRQAQTTTNKSLSSTATDSGLFNLAQAVDLHGRGETVGTSEATELAHKPEPDRV